MSKQSIIFLAILIFVFIRCVFVEPNSIEVTKFEIHSPKLAGIRLVFLSDLHLRKRDYKRLDKIVQLTNKQQPDLVLLGGDYAVGHNYKNMMDINTVASKLSLITAPKYSVLGENDWWADGELIKNTLKNNGITVLEDQSRIISVKRKRFFLIGLGDLTTRQPSLRKAFFKTGMPRIVLTHNPDVYYDIIDSATLILAGHTHGGQFVIPFSKPIYIASKYGAEFAGGYINKSSNQMIISKGLGSTGLPVRFNCKPEIIVVDFIK